MFVYNLTKTNNFFYYYSKTFYSFYMLRVSYIMNNTEFYNFDFSSLKNELNEKILDKNYRNFNQVFELIK